MKLLSGLVAAYAWDLCGGCQLNCSFMVFFIFLFFLKELMWAKQAVRAVHPLYCCQDLLTQHILSSDIDSVDAL